MPTRDRIISFRLTVAEHKALKARAAKAGTDISGLVRRQALLNAQPAPAPTGTATTAATRGHIVWADESCGATYPSPMTV